MAASGGFVASGRGNLNLQRLFEFTTVDEIKDLLLRIQRDPVSYGVPAQHTRKNKLVSAAPGHPLNRYNTNGRSYIDQAIDYVITQLCFTGAFRQFVPAQDESEVLYLSYNDESKERILYGYTIYDALGWILSLTAVPDRVVPNMDRFFYLPLLAVYGK